MNYLTLFQFAIACISSVLGASDGYDAVEGQFDYQAFISKSNQVLTPIAGGVILNEFYIITSAVSVYEYISTPEKIVAFFGTIRIRLDAKRGEIAEIDVPLGYNRSSNDGSVALLKMKNPIQLSNNVQPIDLPESNYFEGMKAIFSGFGCDLESQHGGQSYEYPHKLIYCETSFKAQKDCMELHKEHRSIVEQINANKLICTRGAAVLRSVELAGNPLVLNNTLYGLSLLRAPDLYTNVFFHKKWIEETINSKGIRFY